MQKIVLLISIFSLLTIFGFSQEKSLKDKALDEFKKEHYTEAIELLEKAVNINPNDAELYYYLGWFNHYRAYDSRPLKGYDFSYSDRIFMYLDKALELDPEYGDAKYFYGAECSGNAFIAMQNYDAVKLRYFYELAYQKGAYPDWLIEWGKNILNSCDSNAILFTGGNPDFDICAYLQICMHYRTDVTIIPIGNIDRPWYVEFLKNGLKDCIRSVKINLTDEQIMDIHPFKWNTTDVFIKVSPVDKVFYDLEKNFEMKWTIEPDLVSERMHSKIEGEKPKKRMYLSPQRAILLQIVEDNMSERPIFFSNYATPIFYGGLNEYFQDFGLVSKLTPVKTANTEYEFSKLKLEQLLKEQNLVNFRSMNDKNMPRISGLVVNGYNRAVLNLNELYNKLKETSKSTELLELYTKMLQINLNPENEKQIIEEIKGH